MKLYTAALTWVSDLLPWAGDIGSLGDVNNDFIAIPFNVNYAVSLLVAVDVTTTTGMLEMIWRLVLSKELHYNESYIT